MNDLLYTVRGEATASGRQVSPLTYDVEAGLTAQHSERGKEMDEFFKQVEAIKVELTEIKARQREIQQLHEHGKTLVQKRDMHRHREEMQSAINAVNALAHRVKAKIEAVDKLNEEALRKKGLRKKLKELMGEFTELRGRIQAEYREVVERRVYTVTGQHLPEEDIDRMIESGEAENIFQKAILEQGRGRVLDTVAEIQERHRAVKDLEQGLLELHQIFLDMAVLVEAQGEMLDNIEKQVQRSMEFVQGGTAALQDAKKLQKNTRKWMCCGIILLLVVAAIIVIFVVKPWTLVKQ